MAVTTTERELIRIGGRLATTLHTVECAADHDDADCPRCIALREWDGLINRLAEETYSRSLEASK